jgi:hypothetical protein
VPLLAFLLVRVSLVGAQVVGGRAVRLVGQDSVPLAGASVVLHRLSAREQGPIDSVVVGRDGRFRFRVTADTLALLLASTRYSGIEYFSRPARMAPGTSDTALLVLAADTSSIAPISIGARYLVLNRPGPGGGRGVLDLIVLQNRGGVTLVAADTTQPSWRMRPAPGSVEENACDRSPKFDGRIRGRCHLWRRDSFGRRSLAPVHR